ncbi:MAG: class I SAM-dependent methyltransferase [Phycisphaerae bacterium]
MSVKWTHRAATVEITEVAGDKRRIEVTPADPKTFISRRRWETHYPLDLIRAVFDVKGPIWLCDEIMRDESLTYICFDRSILGYVEEKAFAGKTILDFGCGSGGSTMNLARMFPESSIIGVELQPKFVDLARRRAAFYGYENVAFMLSPSGCELPEGIGEVDFVVMEAVYEHLLPNERPVIMARLWSLLKPGGLLFLMATPNRYFLLESHTTGLPLLNYMPAWLALFCARTFSCRVKPDESWDSLLRKGVRGGSVREIKRFLRCDTDHPPIHLEPCRGGLQDVIDIWYAASIESRPLMSKRLLRWILKAVKCCFGVNLVPGLNLAFKKMEEHDDYAGSGKS